MRKKTLRRLSSLALSAALCLSLLPTAARAEDERPRDWWMAYYGMGWQTDEVSGFRFYVDEYCNIHWDLSSGPDTTPTDPDPTPDPAPDPTPTPDPAPDPTPTPDPSDTSSSQDLTDPDVQREYLDIRNGELLGFTAWGAVRGTLVIPDGVTRIGNDALSWNQSMTGVAIPDSVQEIGDRAFYRCDLLASVTIPDGVPRIGDQTFWGCESLTYIRIPDSVTSIGYAGLDGCSSLTAIDLPQGLTEIGDFAFRYCNSLTEVTIPDSVTTIGALAFAGCDNLTRITIPDQVDYIGEDAFGFPADHITIYGDTGSVAEAYAKEYDCAFVSTGVSKKNPPKPREDAPNVASASAWAREGLNDAHNAGLIPAGLQAGYTQPATRAEFCALATALYETVTGTEPYYGRSVFTDTTDVNVSKMAGLGVVSGIGNGRFDPDGKLTREQAASMLSRLAEAIGFPLSARSSTAGEAAVATVERPMAEKPVFTPPAATPPTFADNAAISSWAFDAVGQVQATGIMSGVGNNTFDPQGKYTREQSILTMYRLYAITK